MSVSDCDCMILCGGFGRRLEGVVSDVPKVMAEIDGRPFLDFILDYLQSQDIKRVILCTGYKADCIEQNYSEHDFKLTIDFLTEKEPLGTGGAVKNAREVLRSNPFFVLNGDSLLLANLQDFLKFHIEKNSDASLLVSQSTQREDFGNIQLNDDGRIIDFQEKIKGSENHYLNAGIYCFNEAIFSYMPEQKNFSLEHDLFPKLVAHKFYGHQTSEQFMDIGTPERYEAVKNKLRKDQ